MVQYLGYERLLEAGLRETEIASRRRGLKRWVIFAVIWQSLVIAGVLVYVLLMTRSHHPDISWISPPIAALLGTALPYQLTVMRLARAGRG